VQRTTQTVTNRPFRRNNSNFRRVHELETDSAAGYMRSYVRRTHARTNGRRRETFLRFSACTGEYRASTYNITGRYIYIYTTAAANKTCTTQYRANSYAIRQTRTTILTYGTRDSFILRISHPSEREFLAAENLNDFAPAVRQIKIRKYDKRDPCSSCSVQLKCSFDELKVNVRNIVNIIRDVSNIKLNTILPTPT